LLVRRHILGLIVLASFAWTAILYACPALAPYRPTGDLGLRVGLVLGAVWLAWPELERLPGWVWYVLPLGILALIYAGRYLVFLAPVLGMATIAFLLYRKLWRSSPR
jgi:hypothetical protein